MGLAGLRQGAAHLKPSESQSKTFVPFVSWKAGESKTVAFLTPIDEVAKVRMHPFVKVPADNEKGFKGMQFMCRKDPAWLSESGGECYICDILGAKAQEQHTAIAIELDVNMPPGGTPSDVGLSVATKAFTRDDGSEVVYPQWGLVRQSFGNFFNYLTAFGQKWGGINHVAFDISRVGGDKHTSYVFMPLVGTALPDLNQFDEPIPSLVDVLTGLGSQERYEQLLDSGADTLKQGFDEDEDAPQTFNQSGVNNEVFQTEFEKLKSQLPDLHGKVESFTGR